MKYIFHFPNCTIRYLTILFLLLHLHTNLWQPNYSPENLVAIDILNMYIIYINEISNIKLSFDHTIYVNPYANIMGKTCHGADSIFPVLKKTLR